MINQLINPQSIPTTGIEPGQCAQQGLDQIDEKYLKTTFITTKGTTASYVMPEDQILTDETAIDDTQIAIKFDENDEKIMNATVKALQSGSLTPLIKEELRITIQSRRMAKGKEPLEVIFKDPPGKKAVSEMPEDERKRALKRRQQNREAATRFRQRQKDTSDYLSAKIKRLQNNSDSLLKELERLRKEKDELSEMLSSHLLVCTNHNVPSHPATEFDIEHLLGDLSQSKLVLQCPDSSESSNSVFFPDNGSETSSIAQPNRSSVSDLGGSVSFYEGSVADDVNDSTMKCYSESSDVNESTSVWYEENSGVNLNVSDMVPFGSNKIHDLKQPTMVCCDGNFVGYLDETPDVVCEEEVVEMDSTDPLSDFTVDGRLDSFCHAGTGPSLSESASEIRLTLASAFSKVHTDSTSTQPFETTFMTQDFLLASP